MRPSTWRSPGGRIAAVEANIPAGAAEVIDARGRFVVPGLIDVHTHYARDLEGPAICLEDGVTAWVDAGSAGADAIDGQVEIARAAPQQGRILVNIGRAGILPGGDTMDLDLADVGAATDAIARHRDLVVGVKARLTRGVAADDVEVLRRAQAAASAFDLPVMIHMGQTASPLPAILELLKPGDVVTHMLAPPPNAIVDEAGRILPAVLAARRRGVWFDVANGRTGHVRWDIVDQVIEAGFWPDTISTDGNTTSRSVAGVVDLPNVMSKFLNAGMPLDAVVACATVNASRVFPHLNDRGTLHVGARADSDAPRPAGRRLRLRRQLREPAHRPPAPVPGRDGARRPVDSARLTTRPRRRRRGAPARGRAPARRGRPETGVARRANREATQATRM